MWSLFKFKSRPKAAATAPAAPPAAVPTPPPLASGISFDPKLIAKLKGEHAELFAIFKRLLDAATTSQLARISDDLILFRRAFQSHILLENVRFYVYMDRLLVHQPEDRDRVRALRRDMNGIAKAVADFIHAWVTTPATAQTLPAFAQQLQGVGSALVARVELEESTLYTLYVESL